MRGFGELEAEVMTRLWARAAPTTVRELVDQLQRERPIAYTTVMTVMDTLFKKGWLRRELDGRAYRYVPVATREQHSAEVMREVLDASGDRTTALVHFLEQLTAEEAAALQAAFHEVSRARPGVGEGAGERAGERGRRRLAADVAVDKDGGVP